MRTTVAVPAGLLAEVDRAVREGKARSRNAFVAAALRRELAARARAEIDAAFAGMADDAEGQAEARQIAAEFAAADWETLQAGER